MLRATLNETIPLQLLVPDARTDLFVRVRVYNAAGAVVATLSLVHVAEGLYSVNWSPASEGYFSSIFEVFLDSGFLLPADYDKDGEQIEVNSSKTNIQRLLGLTHENSSLDQQVYNMQNRLLAARLRSYDTAVNVGTDTGVLFTWNMIFTYDGGGRLTNMKMVRA